MLKVVIIDDEKRARESLHQALITYCENIKIIGEANSVKSGVTLLNSKKPDIVMLDIQMKDGTGFDLMNHIHEPEFALIFVTAHNEHAIKAFKYSAVDYLIKPIDPEELLGAINKCRKFSEKFELNKKIEALSYNIKNSLSEPKKIVLNTDQDIHLVDIDKIVYCESDGNYTSVCIEGQKTVVVSKLLREFEDLLIKQGFFRSHQSFLFNIGYFQSFKKNENIVILKNEIKIPVSTRKKHELLEFIKTRKL